MDAVVVLQYLALFAIIGLLAHASIDRQWLANVAGVSISVLAVVLLASSHIAGEFNREVMLFVSELLLLSAIAVVSAGAAWRRLNRRRLSGSHPIDK